MGLADVAFLTERSLSQLPLSRQTDWSRGECTGSSGPARRLRASALRTHPRGQTPARRTWTRTAAPFSSPYNGSLLVQATRLEIRTGEQVFSFEKVVPGLCHDRRRCRPDLPCGPVVEKAFYSIQQLTNSSGR